jgi:O-antigen ligase/polysaccharide polymerase Wzy-like membrane protein
VSLSAVPETPGFRDTTAATARITFNDKYCYLFLILLSGYAFLGKAFAYLGVPPLYVGEIMLLLGVVALFRSGCLIASVASIPSVVLITFMGLVAISMSTTLGRYGVDALRDSVVVLYGIFAFIVAALLIEKPARIEGITRFYRKFATLYAAVPVLFMVIGPITMQLLPTWPTAGAPLVFVRAGEVGVHLAGITAFTLLGFRKQTWTWSLFLILGAAIVVSQNRGGMLAFAVPTAIAVVFATDRRKIRQLVCAAVLISVIAIITNVDIPLGGTRRLQFSQFTDNVVSLFADSSTSNLDGTKEWRKRWWETIVRYTIHGDQFWSGRGFGPNLAETDGYGNWARGDAPLRSPHSAHMTILARLGVPGLALWIVTLLVWFSTMFRNAYMAWRNGEPAWGRFFVFISCYALAAIIDSSFDVALEGPMVGIWFWTLIGAGLGTSMVYWSRYSERSALRYCSRGLV